MAIVVGHTRRDPKRVKDIEIKRTLCRMDTEAQSHRVFKHVLLDLLPIHECV